MRSEMKKNEDAVSPVIAIILMVAITVVLAGVLYVWVTSLADTGETVDTLQLDGELTTNGATAATLTITHRGGDKVTWADYKVTCNGTTVTSATTETSVGESGVFAMVTVGGTAIAVGEEYTARIIDLESNKIVWEDTLTAKVA